MATYHPRGRFAAPKGSESGGGANTLCAWLFEIDQDGCSTPMLDQSDRTLKKIVEPGAFLEVSTEGGQDTLEKKYLRLPPYSGMAVQPITVLFDENTGFWTLTNSGSTNTLRIQQYGLGAVPLHPGASIAMSGTDVAVWIPVRPSFPRVSGNGEAFRLLLLRTAQLSWTPGITKHITGPAHVITENMREALILYFGQYLSWPPLVAPHVRGETEVREIAAQAGLIREPDLKKWAFNRHAVLAGNDGLFGVADWYPQIGGKQRTIANHLVAFQRLVERRTVTFALAQRWAERYDAFDFINIDQEVRLTSRRGVQPGRI